VRWGFCSFGGGLCNLCPCSAPAPRCADNAARTAAVREMELLSAKPHNWANNTSLEGILASCRYIDVQGFPANAPARITNLSLVFAEVSHHFYGSSGSINGKKP
jgi:hypothetical protein